MTRALTIAALLIILSACSSSPTAPTPAPAAAAAISIYRWDMTSDAAGCVIAKPLPSLTNATPSSVVELEAGRRRVFYADGARRANGDQDFIGGDFVALDKVYALCSWAHYSRGINP